MLRALFSQEGRIGVRKQLIALVLICLAVSYTAVAVGISGNLLVSMVAMDQVNLLIDQYNGANQAEVSGLRLGWGAEADVSFGELAGIIPCVGLRGMVASSTAQREKVQSSLVGFYVGGTFQLGPLGLSTDIGAYRSSFSFPAAQYEGLTGWSGGIIGEASYTLRLTSALQVSLGVRLHWLPVQKLHDAEGGVYELREGAFLDFSGIGLSIGLAWTGF